jgi:hypothetical protein
MDSKPSFFESESCTSRLHCDTCRARHAGRIWRGALRKAFRLPGVDFDCPEGKAWIEDRSTTDTADAPRRKPCKGCGKTAPAADTASPIYNERSETPVGSSDSWKEVTNPPLYGETRASCIECIEKHVGAAMVLLSETKNGYPHYLLAVGHLHEAEEESQAWPDLAAAIRAARKALQSDGTIPDLLSLAELLKNATTAPQP